MRDKWQREREDRLERKRRVCGGGVLGESEEIE